MTETISTNELAQRLEDPNLVLVDIRPIEAFNGWALKGETRGGHIQGAIACPETWTAHFESNELKTLLESKGISADKTVVVYAYTPEKSAKAAKMLESLGYADVLAYEAGFAEWAARKDLPVAHLVRYEKLVHAKWVHRLINGEEPETYQGNSFGVYHVNFGVPEEYEAGHIPGAVHLDTLALESEVSWNRRSPEELEAALLAHGITHDKTVVIYGKDDNPTMKDAHPGKRAGQIAATRAAAILMYSGVEDVRLLDGGFDSWLSAGYEVEMGVVEPVPVESFGVKIPAHPEYMIDIEEAKSLIADPNGSLVSIRSLPEFLGNVSGYHYIGPRGRIAGAVWGNCGTDAYHMQHYRNIDNTMRDYHEIEANWKIADITPEKRIAFYCGTGWRASETFFYAYIMGFPHVAVYDGGWFEWSKDVSNPIEIGEPQAGEISSKPTAADQSNLGASTALI